MAEKPPKYANVFTDRHGRRRAYFRYRGACHQIEGKPFSPEWWEAYAHLLRTVAGQEMASRRDKDADTIRWLVTSYLGSPDFQKLAPRTQADYRKLLEPVMVTAGDKSYLKATRAGIIKHVRDPAAKVSPRVADRTVMALSAVYTWALDRTAITVNPCRGIRKLYDPGDGFRVWTAAEIEQFCEKCDDWLWLIFALAFYTSLRASDLIKLTWFNYDGEYFSLKQNKTGKKISLKVHDVVRELLAAMPRREGHIVTRRQGRPYTEARDLASDWSREMRRLGLSGCTVHGLRKTSATMVANAGGSDAQIQRLLGHKTRQMAARYTREAGETKLAADAVGMLPNIDRNRKK